MSLTEKHRDAHAIHSGHINVSLPSCVVSSLLFPSSFLCLIQPSLSHLIFPFLQVSSSTFSLKRRKGSFMNYLTVRHRSHRSLYSTIELFGHGMSNFTWGFPLWDMISYTILCYVIFSQDSGVALETAKSVNQFVSLTLWSMVNITIATGSTVRDFAGDIYCPQRMKRPIYAVYSGATF